MTTEAKGGKVMTSPVEKTPSLVGANAVAQVLEAFSLLPFHAFAEGRGRSIPSLLHEATGLSKARISNGQLDSLRPSTLKKINERQKVWLEEQFQNNAEALEQAQQRLATAPKTQSGANALWAGFMHQFEFLPDLPLSITKAVSLKVDDLVEELLSACHANDLHGFKQAVLSHLKHHGLAVRLGTDPTSLPSPKADPEAWLATETWEQAERLTRQFVDHLYWDLISTMDAEWCGAYFQSFQAMPVFPLVMVRPQDGLVETLRVSSRKNVYFRPTRRLLEFLYAMVFYIRYKKWPDRAPSPKTLAGILYRPNATELPGESLISNYFDGSTKLTADLVGEHWQQIFEHFMPERKEADRSNPPLPMIMLALQWQTLMVHDKGRSFYLPDLEKYQALWQHRRRQWEAAQAEQASAAHPTGHKMGAPIEWPAWMLNQSSSSS